MLVQIEQTPDLSPTQGFWIIIAMIAFTVIVCFIIRGKCKKVTPISDENDPMNEEIEKIAHRNIKIKSPDGKINCTEHGVQILYSFNEAFEFSKSHPYYYFQYWDYDENDFWQSRSDFFCNYNYEKQC